MRQNYRTHIHSMLFAAVAAVTVAAEAVQAVPAFTGSYSENFDALPNSPTSANLNGTGKSWADDSSLAGWYYMTTLNAGTELGYQRLRIWGNNSTTGALYSFGPNGDTDRALGFLNSNTFSSEGEIGQYMALRLRNDSSTTYTSFEITYDGEQWHTENTATQSINFSYKLDAAGLSDPTYTAVPTLDFTSPKTGSSAAIDGNAPDNRVGGITATITGINWEPGQDLWLRWTDLNDAGRDHGLAVDNLSVSAAGSGTATSHTFSADADGNFSNIANWTNGLPSASSGVIRLGSQITADRTVTADTNVTGTGLVLSPGTHNYTVAAGGGTISFTSGAAVTLSNGVYSDGLPVGSSTIAAPLAFASDAEFNVGDHATLTVSGAISVGSGNGLHKTGSGTLTLTSPHTYSGPTVIDGGVIAFSATDQLGDDSATNGIVVHNGAGINPTADVTMSRPFSFDAGGVVVRSDSNVTFVGPISGPGMLRKVLSGTLTTSAVRTDGIYASAFDRTGSTNAGILRIAPNGTDAATSVVKFLRIETTSSDGLPVGKIDVSDNKLIVDYTLTGAQHSPLGGSAANLPTSEGLTASRLAASLWYAYDGGHWDRNGITSARATTATADPASIYSVGYADAARFFGISGSETASFGGQTVDATSVLIMGTYGGDANLDGTVNQDDYVLVDRGYLIDQLRGNTTRKSNSDNVGLYDATHSQWQDGDFNYDTVVDDLDYAILDKSFIALHPGGFSTEMLAQREAQFGSEYVSQLLASVPEPTSLAACGLGVVGLMARRRRQG